ncbi:SgcJ/EcaC family oxidoreductase [Micromonospora sp. WMMD1082]|uniref:SgcJ/EcaC family oxidoreductase n=1 Tax=Micromonospora sp. WMMD1082 TaxID=3016104 RepID=UPI002417C66E|nr:SgcJ/EcaC family oxidoreductase [Micromonospora sp. WMMD1082]MDG4792773.1 SgcJ/EcaC family oxidoreductase [Micromonospora sp. WMMD1082]
MTTPAKSLVAGAKEWAGRYGDYANGAEGAALTAALRVHAAWNASDADGIADMFVENGSLLIGDNQLVSRTEIRSYLADAFAGGFKGTRFTEEPQEVRLLSGSIAVVVSRGGLIRAGAERVLSEDEARGLWVIVRDDGDWRVFSYQSSPLRG